MKEKILLWLLKAMFVTGLGLVATGNEVLMLLGGVMVATVLIVANGGVKATVKKILYEEK